MYNDGPEFVQSIRVAHPVGRVEEPKFEREDDAVRELDVPLEALLVLEPFEVQREDVGKLLDLHPVLLIHQPPTVAAPKKRKGDLPLLGLLQPATLVARELVLLTQHLARTELAKTGRDGGVGFDIDREVEESFVARRDLRACTCGPPRSASVAVER